jgi:FtsP/CotA-like multicopper oxidase with cupredoxin domain
MATTTHPASGHTRRSFLKMGAAGAAGAAAFSGYGLLNWAPAAQGRSIDLDLFVTDGVAPMVDGTSAYVRTFSPAEDKPSLPGPLILVAEGDQLTITVTNTLDVPHAFAIKGVVDSGPIAPGRTVVLEFDAPPAGTYLYEDPTDSPLYRLLGLHGALITMPADGANRPYDGGPEFTRQYVWVVAELDPHLNDRMRDGKPLGTLDDYEPRYFMINGASGVDALEDKTITPHGKVGEPALIRLVNGGAASHAMHFHGNHLHVLCQDGRRLDLQMLKDTIRLTGGETKDALLPFKPPPDAWPPTRSSSYPMHCHAEMTQTAGGGLYPHGMLAHWQLEE